MEAMITRDESVNTVQVKTTEKRKLTQEARYNLQELNLQCCYTL